MSNDCGKLPLKTTEEGQGEEEGGEEEKSTFSMYIMDVDAAISAVLSKLDGISEKEQRMVLMALLGGQHVFTLL